MHTPFLRKLSILFLVLLLPQGIFSLPNVAAVSVSYTLDGSFTKTVVQVAQTARAEIKAGFGITIGDASQ